MNHRLSVKVLIHPGYLKLEQVDLGQLHLFVCDFEDISPSGAEASSVLKKGWRVLGI